MDKRTVASHVLVFVLGVLLAMLLLYRPGTGRFVPFENGQLLDTRTGRLYTLIINDRGQRVWHRRVPAAD